MKSQPVSAQPNGHLAREPADDAVATATVEIIVPVFNEERSMPGRVRVLHMDGKGRGRALRQAWAASDADIVAYLDVDLSTGLLPWWRHWSTCTPTSGTEISTWVADNFTATAIGGTTVYDLTEEKR